MSTQITSHRVKDKDRARIKCTDCGGPADVCRHVHWETGGRKGVSFFYHCDADYNERYGSK